MANRSKYINGFMKEKYDRINVVVPKGMLARLRAAISANQLGDSVNAVLNEHIANIVADYEDEGAKAARAMPTAKRKASELEQKKAKAIASGYEGAVKTKMAAELLGYAEGTVRKAVSRGQLIRHDTDKSLIMLSSVIERAELLGIDISEKLKEV